LVYVELVSLEGLSYVVTIKEDIRDKDLRIICCEDSEIFINSKSDLCMLLTALVIPFILRPVKE